MEFKIVNYFGYMALVAIVLSYPADESEDFVDESINVDYNEASREKKNIRQDSLNSTLTFCVTEQPLDFDFIQALVNKFANITCSSNTSEILKHLDNIEDNIQMNHDSYAKSIERGQFKLNRYKNLSKQISAIKSKLGEVSNITSKFEDFARQLNTLGQSFVEEVGNKRNSTSGSGYHTAWAILHRSRGHSGRTLTLDFRNCSSSDDCCVNLSDLNNDSQSIQTHDTCVIMYNDADCLGDYVAFYPGSSTPHTDFGPFNDVFSSGKPCLEPQ